MIDELSPVAGVVSAAAAAANAGSSGSGCVSGRSAPRPAVFDGMPAALSVCSGVIRTTVLIMVAPDWLMLSTSAASVSSSSSSLMT